MRRAAVLTLALGLALAACGDDADDRAASTTTSTAAGTTVITTGTTESTSSSSTTSTSEAIPPLTPPPGQPAACSLLSEAEFPGAALVPDALVPDDQPDGQPAPSTGCRFEAPEAASLGLWVYYGIDPLEILAVVRQQSPGGTDVIGVGADAYYVSSEHALYVDAGSQAFVVRGAISQQDLESLATNVVTNL